MKYDAFTLFFSCCLPMHSELRGACGWSGVELNIVTTRSAFISQAWGSSRRPGEPPLASRQRNRTRDDAKEEP
jgi:hypothetical protein